MRRIALALALVLVGAAALATHPVGLAQDVDAGVCPAGQHWSSIHGERPFHGETHHCCPRGTEWTGHMPSCPSDIGSELELRCMSAAELAREARCGDEPPVGRLSGSGSADETHDDGSIRAVRAWLPRPRVEPPILMLDVRATDPRLLASARAAWGAMAGRLAECAMRDHRVRPDTAAAITADGHVVDDGHVVIDSGTASDSEGGQCMALLLSHLRIRPGRARDRHVVLEARPIFDSSYVPERTRDLADASVPTGAP